MTARRVFPLLLLLVVALGAWLRLPRPIDRVYIGSDEGFCAAYVGALDSNSWPRLIADYIVEEKKGKDTRLPPTRVLFIGSGHLVRKLTDCAPIEALRAVSCAASIAALLIGAAFVWRIGGPASALAVTALMASSPLLIHLAHRALIDGFFALWALVSVWGLWESLRAPGDRRWLVLYATGLIAMVLTKENAAFAFVALVALIALNRWLQIGTVTRPLLIVTFTAPALGAGLLILAAGGLPPLIEAYRLNVTKSVVLPYAITTGDGPWHRYLLDFLLVSPVVTVLAAAALGGTPWRDPAKRYLGLFLLLSYALMAQVRYGMNMRYGAMWTLPLCWLGYHLLATLSARLRERWQPIALAAAVALVCASELHGYRKLFVSANIYDPVPGALAMPLRMWKP